MSFSDHDSISQLYTNMIVTESKKEDVEDLQKLHDDPDEDFAIKNYGSVKAYKDMLKKKIEKLKEESNCNNESTQRPKDEVSSDKIVGDGATKFNFDIIDLKKPNKKKFKNKRKKINNSKKAKKVMTEDKSIFDKLFEQVMGDSDEENMELGINTGDDEGMDPEMGDMDDMGDMGEEVTITLSSDQISVLKDILAQVDMGDEEDDEEEDMMDLDDTEEMDMGYDSEPVEEENQHTGQGKKTGIDPTGHSKPGAMKKSELPNDVLGGKSTGTGDVSVTDEVSTKHTGAGKKSGHDVSGMSRNKSLRVK